MIALPDVNVLLALVWSNHPHHEAAHEWFARDAHLGWATTLMTQSAFLRLSMNPHVVGTFLDCRSATQLLAGLVSHPEHRYVEATPALSGAVFDELVPLIVGYRQVTDAVLLHTARVHGMKLVTFDKPLRTICPWPENLATLPQAPAL